MGLSYFCLIDKNEKFSIDDSSSESFLQLVLNSSLIESINFLEMIKYFSKFDITDFKETRLISYNKYSEIILKHLFVSDIMKNQYALIHCSIYESLAVTQVLNNLINLNKSLSLFLFFSKDNLNEKVKYFLLLNRFIIDDTPIIFNQLVDLLYEYFCIILIKFNSSFIFSLYNERYLYKKLLNSLNNLAIYFTEERVMAFIKVSLFDNYNNEKIEKSKIEEVFNKNRLIFDFLDLRKRFLDFQ